MAAFEKLKAFKPGQNARAILLLLEVSQKETQNGKCYCRLLLSDGKETHIANMWDTKQEAIEPLVEGLVQCIIKNEIYKDTLTFIVSEINKAPDNPEKYTLKNFIVSAPVEADTMYDELLDAAVNYDGPDSVLYKITEHIFTEYKDNLLCWAGAKTVHHAYQSGLLYHMYRMMLVGRNILSVYDLHKDVFITGLLLHDIGKLKELDTNPLGCANYTTNGDLFGHTLLGLEIFDEAVAAVKKEFDSLSDENLENEVKKEANSFSDEDLEKIRLVKHMIASHHGKTEFGAIITPSIPEAMILHHIDTIDSRMDVYEKNLPEPGTVSDKIWALDGYIYSPSI